MLISVSHYAHSVGQNMEYHDVEVTKEWPQTTFQASRIPLAGGGQSHCVHGTFHLLTEKKSCLPPL